ncbi:hypothetical protein FHS82_001008 [Pseudochelatococcus lubricantis]|uniref:Uncharacterized protein n=1 Tax=Pseudochelatococcus lubricantis TaxID=1538102 RepID=A0ABX0UW45_9HYPH|nr:hypothetical protein [Pseudochelatococcus lubricantis]NIJ57182.1 hypothetical protein [Pseudochelatococcus lubricantis]
MASPSPATLAAHIEIRAQSLVEMDIDLSDDAACIVHLYAMNLGPIGISSDVIWLYEKIISRAEELRGEWTVELAA